jgi:hypothetical protein
MSVIWVRSNKQANGGLLGDTFHETQQEGLAGPGTPASELFIYMYVCMYVLKGTVARDFWPLVFFMNRPHMGP